MHSFFCYLDVSDIKYVINFDFPNNSEDYVHRIGRTARAKRTGTAYSLFTSANAKQAKDLVDVLKEAKQEVDPQLYEMMQLSKHMFGLKSKLCPHRFYTILYYSPCVVGMCDELLIDFLCKCLHVTSIVQCSLLIMPHVQWFHRYYKIFGEGCSKHVQCMKW